MSGSRRRYVELINAQYGAEGLAESILRRARRRKPDAPDLGPSDLYPFDQVHTGAVAATRELARMAGFAPGHRVLDVGCGLGGTARFLAAECGCRVAGVDLTEAYVLAAHRLTAAVGLAGRAGFLLGDAADLPVRGGRFDAAILQHCTMNVPDHGRLFRECARGLRADGVLALHEWVKLGRAPLFYPVRWADTPEIDHIAPQGAFRERLAEGGFVAVEVRDVSEASRRWMEARAAEAESPRAGLLFANMARNIVEGRAACLMAVCRKHQPGARGDGRGQPTWPPGTDAP